MSSQDNGTGMSAQQIFYQLLQKRQLDSRQPEYQQMTVNPQILDQVEMLSSAFECSLFFYDGSVYLYPQEENTFLGYSKAGLKSQLIKSNETVVVYYLQMFIVLTLMIEFFETEYGDGRLRESIDLSMLMNKVAENLRAGMKMDAAASQIPFEQIYSYYNSLEDPSSDSKKHHTKLAIYQRLFDFLEAQGLVRYLPARRELRVTPRFGALVQNVLRRDEGHEAVLKIMEDLKHA